MLDLDRARDGHGAQRRSDEPGGPRRQHPRADLLLTGEHDPRVLPHEVEAIRARLGGPAKLVVFPGAGHVGLHSADAALWRSSVSTFLNREAPHTGRNVCVRTPPPTP